VTLFLPKRDKEGRRILIARPGKVQEFGDNDNDEGDY